MPRNISRSSLLSNRVSVVLHLFRSTCQASCLATFTTNTWVTSSTRCGQTSLWMSALQVMAGRRTTTVQVQMPARVLRLRWPPNFNLHLLPLWGCSSVCWHLDLFRLITWIRKIFLLMPKGCGHSCCLVVFTDKKKFPEFHLIQGYNTQNTLNNWRF